MNYLSTTGAGASKPGHNFGATTRVVPKEDPDPHLSLEITIILGRALLSCYFYGTTALRCVQHFSTRLLRKLRHERVVVS